MASLADHEKVNGARLSRLLIDKGTEAMRLVFDSIHPPVSLTATLNSYYSFLKNKPFINSSQMSILFPPSGIASQSRDFDITLLFILLRNICGLHPPPSTGSWDTNPPSWDKTREANLARIKYYRNKVYGHITTTGVNDTDFHSYWNDISTAVVDLGVDEGDVKFLQFSPLDESLYIRQLIEWKKQEDQVDVRLKEIEKNLKEMFHSLESGHHRQEAIQEDLKVVVGYHKELKEDVQELKSKPELQQQPNILQHLAKCEFKSNIECLNNSFHSNTRKWLLKKLDCWFQNNDSDSQVMVLTAGPGVGKSVFAAKVCTIYKEKAQLAACHFCKFNFSDYSNPHKMMQSLAMHMCENVPGFRERLIEQLQRAHSKESITDAFRVLFKDPLDSLPAEKPLLLVIDGLDESEMYGKSELLDLIAKEFLLLPKWLKIFITSRPELPVRKKLDHLNPIEILPDDEDNKADLRCYLRACLTYHKKLHEYELEKLVEKCEGSFLYAHYCQLELNRLPLNTNIAAFAPKGISSVYEDYFTRLEKELKELSPNIQFDRILGVLVAMRGPLPLSFIAEILELPGDNRSMRKVIQKVNESLSALLLVYDDCLTVFHKSVVDWIMCEGYEQHSFSIQDAECISGHKYLWEACQETLVGSKQENPNAKNYASNLGAEHLREITLQPKPKRWMDVEDNEKMTQALKRTKNDTRSLEECSQILQGVQREIVQEIWSRNPGLARVLCQSYKPFGWGWVIAEDGDDVFLLTSNTVVFHLKKRWRSDSPKEEGVLVLQIAPGNFTYCCATGKEDEFCVISSDEDSVFNYAVLRLKLSRENNLRFSFRFNPVTKPSPSPGDILTALSANPISVGGEIRKFSVSLLEKPKDLLRWLRKNNVKYPFVTCQPEMNWDIAEDLHDILVPLNSFFSSKNGPFILKENSSKCMEVIGMVNPSATVCLGLDRIDFAVHIEKIIEDINKKQPNLARRLFSSYFE